MSLLNTLIVWGLSIFLGIVFASIAVSYLPDTVKKWLKNKLFKENKEKK